MEKQKGEANNFEVSFSALRKDVDNVLDIMERLKNEEDQISVDVADLIEKLKYKLAFVCTYIQLSYSELNQFEDRMTAFRHMVENLLRQILDDVDKNCGGKYNIHHVLPSLMDNIDDCINSCHRSKSSATMTNEQLNFLLLNLHRLSEYRAEKIFPSVTEYEILQKVCGNVRYFHGLIVNGCIKHEIAENVLPQFQLMAERGGLFLWNDQISEQDEDNQTDGDSQISEQDEDNQTDGDSQISEQDEDNQTDGDFKISEQDEDNQTDGDSQISEQDEDNQTDGDSQISEQDEDNQTDGDSQISEQDEDNQTDGDSQISEQDEDNQTDGDSQISEQDEDNQTDGDSKISEQDEDNQTDGDSQISEQDEDNQTDGDSQLLKLVQLLLKIVPIELEVMHMCYTNLKASTSAEVGRFIKHLRETSPDILREYLIHLQEHMITVLTPSTSGARNIHVMIEFLLIILTDMPTSFIHHDKLFDLLARVGALTRKVSTLVCGLEEKPTKKESTNETNCTTLDLLKDIELLKGDLRHDYLKAPDSSQICFPMSDGQLFMHLLLIHLKDLLDSNSYSIALIKEEIGLVKENLESIRLFFVNAEQGLYRDLWARILDVAYEAKDVIDSIIVRDNGLLRLIFSLPLTMKNIKHIKEEVSNLHEKIPKNRGLNVVNSPNMLAENKSSTAGKIIVGFEEEKNLIIAKLTHGPADLDVISITGMPGSGKTTLAYRVYTDESVSSHFDIRAWCTVDQGNDSKELLGKIFNQVTGSDLKCGENFDIADKLRRKLFGKRYLIVLDDLWDTDSWDELTRPFPEVEKGSRIILTTRQKEVALHGKRHCDPLNLRLLRPEESWELLEKRVFGKESCPDELLVIGKEIAQNCKGLPLVADLIAGVVARLEKKRTVWLEIQNNLSSFMLNSEVDVMKVIELSYDHLSVHVKPCFLYFVSFGKDGRIRVDMLKECWHAEGLVEQTEMKSVEEVMEIYLDNLISSSLVILFNEIGDFPNCQLHDLVHDFCLKKAREEKFFDLISSSAPSSSSDLMPRTVNIEYDKKEHFVLNNFVLLGSKKKRHSVKHLYSFEIYGGKLDNRLSDRFHLRHLRLLRALYLCDSFIEVKDSLLNEISMLNHLRYLSIGTEIKSLPSSFSNLWNLESLLVYNEGSTLVLLPRIWDLVKLRVLEVSFCCFFDMDTDEPMLEDTKLENLRFLGKLTLSYSKDTEDIFKRFPNLQHLVFVLQESWDYSTERYWFPKLEFLTELEILEVEFESSNTNDSGPSIETNWSWDFHFPSNLKVLQLLDFPLTSDSLSTAGGLPNLEELFLVRTIIQGEEWNIGEEVTFEKLKYLQLKEVTLAKWEVGEESFPVLEKLELWRCHKLEEIPPSFGDIYSLKIIKLEENSQLEDSAKNIKEYVEEMTGEDKLQILGPNNIPLFK